MTSTAPPDTRPAGSAERRRPVDWFVALLWIGAIVATAVQHGVVSENNNFRIFRAASRHLVAGANLYAAYPAEHFDFFKYSPTFALLFAPLAGVSFAIFHPRKLRVAIAIVLGLVLFALLPLLATSPARLLAQYASWRAIEATDALQRGFSVMDVFEQLFHTGLSNWPIQLAGVLILVAPVVVQVWRWHDWDLRRLYLCSVLVFCVIFNHQAESPTFAIAITGVAIWFAAIARPSRWEWALLAFVAIFTILASSDLMPRAIQRDFFDRYRFKTVPLIVLWIELQRRLWFPRVREAKPS